MAVDITTPKATAPAPPEPARVPGWELFRWVYRFFYSKTVGLVLILAMAVLVLIGTLLQPQATAADKATSAAYQQFLDGWHDKLGPFGPLTSMLDGLGLFDVYRSPLFVVVSALLAASILACTAHRFPLLWRNWRHPRLVVPARAYEAARYRAAVPVDDGDVTVMAQVREVLTKQRYRVLTDSGHPKAVYADRFAWGGMGAVVTHLSFVVIIVAVGISLNAGIDKMLLVPVRGEPVAVGSGTSLSVTATSYRAPQSADGRTTDYVSHLVVTKNGQKVGEQDVRVNSPLTVGGVSFHQSSWIDGVDVTAVGPDGPLFDGFTTLDFKHPDSGTDDGLAVGTVTLSETPATAGTDGTTGMGTDGTVGTEGATGTDGTSTGPTTLELWVGVPMGWDPVTITSVRGSVTVQPGQALLEMRRVSNGQTTALDDQLASAGDQWVVGDYTFTFGGDQQSPVVRVRQDPGTPWLWAGSALLVIGTTVVFAFRHRRLWVTWDDGPAGQPGRIRFASTDKSDTAWARRFRETVEAVAQQVGSAAQHGPAPGRTTTQGDGDADSPADTDDEPAEGSSPDRPGTKEERR